MSKKVLNEQDLEKISGGRKWRDKEQKDFKATTAKFMEVYNALLDSGRATEAAELAKVYYKLNTQVYYDIIDAPEDSKDILFSEMMKPYWPKL